MFRKLVEDRQTMMSLGMIALILADISRFFLHPAAPAAQDLVDGMNGVLIGLAIGFTFVSLRRRDRQPA